MNPATIGVLYGNRDFFPDHLVTEARNDIEAVFASLGVTAVSLGEADTKLGGVSTYQDAQRCAALFRRHADALDGVLVCLPNFGDEKAVADTLRLARLGVPVLVQAYPDDPARLSVDRRRDAFCGKISVCNNLRQYGIPFTLTHRHVERPDSEAFQEDLRAFLAICRVVKGLRGCRLGAIGARPAAFNTVRYSEKLLEDAGVTVVTVDWSELLGEADRLALDGPEVAEQLDHIRAYAEVNTVPTAKLREQARLAVVVDRWMRDNAIDATAMQCWTSLQQNRGVNVCTLMAMMGSRLMPSACEVDVTGALTMHALALASGRPSALVDWNNNYGDDPDACVLFHCGNWPAEWFNEKPQMATAPILETVAGEGTTYGALAGHARPGAVTFGRVTTDDTSGTIRAYLGEGEMTDDPLETFGARGVLRVAGLEALMRHICRNGFEHHVAMSPSRSADAVGEAFQTYLGWDVHRHNPPCNESR